MRKKILFLVAGGGQMPVIKYAKQQGHYVITCDNNPSNPGHQIADEVLNIDSYGKEEIFQAVKDKGIDAVVNFVSEHGLETAGYLSEQLGMNGIKPTSLSTLMDKGKFRSFLRDNSFDTPKNKVSTFFSPEIDQGLKYPLIVKPVDRGGSIGITKVRKQEDLPAAFAEAKTRTISGEVIVEEFIDGTATINGDCVVIDSNIVAHLIGDYWYDQDVSPVLPYATAFPTKADTTPIISELERLMEIVGLQHGVFNFEAILSGDSIYFVEINPRHSGNFIYKLMGEAMGVDFAQVSVEIALGARYQRTDFKPSQSYLAYALLFTPDCGTLDKVEISDFLKDRVIEMFLFKKEGDYVPGFNSLHDRVGLLLLKFKDQREMDDTLANIRSYYAIHLK
jgi:biotin carboxylase